MRAKKRGWRGGGEVAMTTVMPMNMMMMNASMMMMMMMMMMMINSTLVEGEVIEVRCDGDGHPTPVEAGFFLAPRAERNGRPIYASGPPLSPQ